MIDIQRIRSQIVAFYDKKKEEKPKDIINNKAKKWQKYYHNKAWSDLRNYYYGKHPCCEVCERQGIVTPADEVHHLRVFGSGRTEKEKWWLLLNESNLCSCCLDHHRLFHKYMREHHISQATIDDIIKYEKDQNDSINDFIE